ncbi:GntR family transcriptional regulator [Microbacterium sp. 18062]|uniref:GntR family transcriptional regulator n=1 Tax=Microbacterium sp. 18062 TaxID=2681410 RepID=UPI00135A07A4|nr:GntR family transcriptional regulator [Microbacterium sp. 18062]
MPSGPETAGSQRRRPAFGDEVFEILGRAIRDGQLQPGRLLRDVDLAAQFGVSRTPVREALQRLERIGLVEIEANRYTRVTVRTPRAIADTRAFVIGFGVEALRMALGTCSSETLATVLAAYDRMLSTPVGDDPSAHTAASSAFFRALSIATGNVVLGRIMREASLTFERNLQGWELLEGSTAAGRAARAELRAAIVSRDADRAERVLRAIEA